MILPILAYGHPILRKKCNSIEENTDEIKSLISNMWETMYNAEGVGLAAPQVGFNKKIFIIDANPLFPKDRDISDFDRLNSKKVFINPKITEMNDDHCFFNEGCLSIPDIRAEIKRPNMIKVEFLDENFNQNSMIFEGLLARVILHENDHINGVLFTDKISSFKRKIIQNKLDRIKKGKIKTEYKMSFS
tara:strand:+ start:7712 stop:8278 length:567 start_codon:yes stop_codon:yes gene_type:complete